jgi:amino acid adenylation domain-containing protein
MINTQQLLAELQARGIRVWRQGDRLRCSAPKGMLTPELQAELGRHKAGILELLPSVSPTPSSTPPPLRCYPRNGRMPLSFGQQRLWFLHRLEPESPAYNIPLVFTAGEACDPARITGCLNEMIRRHEILRTTFGEVEGQPVQVIAPELRLQPREVDLSGLEPQARRRTFTRLSVEALREPFDLARGPLLRASLIHVGGQRFALAIVMHHSITDGWSLALFKEEFDVLFEAARRGGAASLPQPRLHYADYALWQREWLQGEVLADELAYWRQRLGGRLPVLELPLDRPRPPLQSYAGAVQIFSYPVALVERLKAVACARSATFFMLLLAAFKVLLHRYTGQVDLLVGTSNGSRNRPELESMLGFFVNTQVLRSDASGDPSFLEFLDRVKATTLEACAHQDLPFEKLVEELQPERNLSLPPLFQVMFILQNTPLEAHSRQAHALPAVLAEQTADYLVETGTAKFDLTLYAIETAKGLEGHLEYGTALFAADTMKRMLGHFQRLLEAIATEPQLRLSELPLLRATERQQLLVDWNQTERRYPREQCVHELMTAQAERTPVAIALEAKGQWLSYRELNGRANQWAGYLRECGVKPGTRVGVCAERGLDLVVGLLAIWKAGGSYVPLDPAFPPDRLAFMISDAQLSVILTQASLLPSVEQLAADAGDVAARRLICLDRDQARTEAHSGENLPRLAGPEDVAYTLYTSGSTGRPKGVQISHRALVNFLESMRHTPGLQPDDVLLAVTTLSFDIAGLELYLPLLVGAKVVLAEREVAADGAALAAKLAESGATVMQATPATWRMLIEAGWAGDPRLTVLCGGEALSAALAEALLARCGALWNMYGPTETTIWSTLQRVEPGEGLIRIGRPIGNTQAYVLDRRLEPVPIGVAGELCLGGDGLALGYLHRPELTADRFIPCPFGSEPGTRLYRTGDRARYRADGTIECLGRLDHQVKIRGFRIELGEIEAALAALPGVRGAVVVAREEAPGEKRLVAYVIADAPPPTVTELWTRLRDRLPDYMVPSACVFLDSFPLTPNGKIDRRALPAPSGDRPVLEAAFEAPRDEVERKVAAIWREVLHLERVGAHDNFFDLGGHSLLLVKVHSQLRQTFGREIPILQLFRHTTVAALARAVSDPQAIRPAFTHVQDRARKQQARLSERQSRASSPQQDAHE